jgi:hypothetical protein
MQAQLPSVHDRIHVDPNWNRRELEEEFRSRSWTSAKGARFVLYPMTGRKEFRRSTPFSAARAALNGKAWAAWPARPQPVLHTVGASPDSSALGTHSRHQRERGPYMSAGGQAKGCVTG